MPVCFLFATNLIADNSSGILHLGIAFGETKLQNQLSQNTLNKD
jgi:hypothetical protein